LEFELQPIGVAHDLESIDAVEPPINPAHELGLGVRQRFAHDVFGA
jgi:hypothetical protein